MFFTQLTFLAAFFIEGLATLVSIIGISALFGNNLIIMSLVAALDVGKILIVSLLYTHWKKLPNLMRSYALIAATITMLITSAGTAGYLTSAFQQAVLGTQEGALKINSLKEQRQKYEERKKQIDDQIANLSEKTSVNQRLKLMNGFKVEQERLDSQILEIDKTLPTLQVTQINTESKAGPILFMAKSFNISPEEAIKWVILLIVFVFDPLAVFLVIAGNFLYAMSKREKESVLEKETVVLPEKTVVEETKLDVPVQVVEKPVEEPSTFTYIVSESSQIEPEKIEEIEKPKPKRRPRIKKQKPSEESSDKINVLIPETIEPVTSEPAASEQVQAEIVKKDNIEDEKPIDVKDEKLTEPDIKDSTRIVWGNIPKTNIKDLPKSAVNGIPRRRPHPPIV